MFRVGFKDICRLLFHDMPRFKGALVHVRMSMRCVCKRRDTKDTKHWPTITEANKTL